MNLFTIFRRFPDQESCIEHLEAVRWGNEPHCPQCGSIDVARKGDSGRVGRWNCHGCHSSFNVLSGTIFEKTKVPLQKWFLAIGLMIHAKKSLSSCQLARDLDLNQKSAWYVQQRIRAAMAAEQRPLLQGIIEADEAYVGGKPRKRNRRDDDRPNPPGRGTKKVPVLGVVERGGDVAARVTDSVGGRAIVRFLRDTVDPRGSVLITDEWRAYRAADSPHAERTRKENIGDPCGLIADGETHTNTIEGFWALLKRAWYGSHHHYTRHWMPLFVAEATWKYNNRKNKDAFSSFMRGCFA